MNTLGMLKNQRGDVVVRDGVLPQQTAFRILTRHIRLYSVRQLRSSWPHVSCRAQNSTHATSARVREADSLSTHQPARHRLSTKVAHAYHRRKRPSCLYIASETFDSEAWVRSCPYPLQTFPGFPSLDECARCCWQRWGGRRPRGSWCEQYSLLAAAHDFLVETPRSISSHLVYFPTPPPPTGRPCVPTLP